MPTGRTTAAANAMSTIGDRTTLVALFASTPVFNADGSYSMVLAPLTPATWWVRVQSGAATDMERVMSGTSGTRASYVVAGAYHPGVTTSTVLDFTDQSGATHRLYVNSVVNPEFRNIETIAYCEEQVP